MRPITRRRFVIGAATAASGLALGILPSCRDRTGRAVPPPPPEPVPPPPLESTYVDGSTMAFPYLEVSGGPREVGRAIGKRFAPQIRQGLDRRADWFKGLRDFAASAGRDAYDVFVSAARKHTPRALAELEGWAEGSGIPFEDLMVLNLKSELSELMSQRRKAEPQPGCSTIVLVTPERVIHLHNEDGDDAYADLMFMLLVHPDEGPSYLTLSYPGILPGNAPAVNARGLVQTTNFIGSREVRPGVGRYFLDRMILEAGSLDEALAWATHPERAFAFHHVLTSIPDRKSVAVEVTATKKEVVHIEGLFFHTNHLVFETMKDEEQDAEYVGTSSTSRYEVIRAWAAAIEDPSSLTRSRLLEPLMSHESKPYSPCRHPEGDVHGFTLATAVFEAPAATMRVSKSQPCLERWMEYPVPAR
jgi:isopenicillin-N N-acyltransferase-like protein